MRATAPMRSLVTTPARSRVDEDGAGHRVVKPCASQ
jgi:hypothetical protein